MFTSSCTYLDLALANEQKLNFDMETDENFFATSDKDKVNFFEKVNEEGAMSDFHRRLSITNVIFFNAY